MYSRLVVPLVCAAAIVFACGPRPRTAAPTPAATRSARLAVARTHRGAGEPSVVARRDGRDTSLVAASFDVVPEHGGVRLALQLVNLGRKRLEIDFPDGHTRDFVILDAAGHEVWRWGRDRLFTQTVQNRFLAAGDTAVYAERWAGAVPGAYTAVATLRSKNYPVEQRVSFVVRAESPDAPVTAVAAR